MNEEKLKRFNNIIPWYNGLSSDLLFWIVIDTLFLTVVKGFTAAQIVSLAPISMAICIVLQVPILKVIKVIGNTNSVRLGSFLLLMSSILLTFGNNYLITIAGKTFFEIATVFINIANVILKNNLQIQDKSDDYIKIRTKGNTVYAVVTMIISFVASSMFNINNYLPMIFCILFCLISFILSFDIIDFSKYNKTKETKVHKEKRRVKYCKVVIILIISYGLFFSVVNSGQENGKLLIQQELLKNFNVENTALIIGAIICISRIVRVIGNVMFNKIYKKLKDKVGIILPSLLCISLLCMIAGYFTESSIILKFMIMGLGYIIILFIRDPYKVYIQDSALNNTDKENQAELITILELSRKIVRTIISFSFTFILIEYPMILVISLSLILSFIEILICIRLYKLIMVSSKKDDTKKRENSATV